MHFLLIHFEGEAPIRRRQGDPEVESLALGKFLFYDKNIAFIGTF